jgi:hypothetical protein
MGPVERDTPAPNKGELLVFFVRRDTKCAECAQELYSGNMITLDRQRGALCLVCADLDHLEFLPSGDAAVTRRASKYSRLKAVVLQWSRTRQRYERQGILVEAEAIEQAEKECLADADQRRRKAERRAIRAAELDQKFVADFAKAIRKHFPQCPSEEATQIAEHACCKYSGRVGRSAAAKELDEGAIGLAVAAAVRHRFTNYDVLLLRGMDRHEARAVVGGAVARKLQQWSGNQIA